MRVTSVAIATNVATLGVTLLSGYKPATSQLVTVIGTQTVTSGGAPNFNMTNVAISAVSGFNTGDNSTGTISFALSSSDISTTADAGTAYAPPAELAETMANRSGQQFSLQSMQGFPNNSRDLEWQSVATGGAAFTATLQGSMEDVDGDYVSLDTMTASGTQTVTGVTASFLRINLSGVTGGTSPTYIGKIKI